MDPLPALHLLSKLWYYQTPDHLVFLMNFFHYLYPYLDIGLTGVCRWDVIGIVPMAMRSLVLRGIEGIEVLRLNVIGTLGPGRKKVPLYISEEQSLATSSSLSSLHFPSAKTLWLLISPSLLLSVVVHMLLWGLLWVTCLWLCRRRTLLQLVSLAKQRKIGYQFKWQLWSEAIAYE